MIHGENLILAINGSPLAASKSCSLSKSSSFIEVASPTDGSWESFVPSKKGWSMSSDCLLSKMDAYKVLDAAWKAGTALTMSFYNPEDDDTETGTVYIDKLDLQCAKNNLAKMSISLKGSGAISYYPATAININRENIKEGKHYIYTFGGNYTANDYTGGEINSGDFVITRKTRVKLSANVSGNRVFLSRSITLVTKLDNLQDITPSDYEIVLGETEVKKLWLDAGHWYVVESLDDPQNLPTYTAIG